MIQKIYKLKHWQQTLIFTAWIMISIFFIYQAFVNDSTYSPFIFSFFIIVNFIVSEKFNRHKKNNTYDGKNFFLHNLRKFQNQYITLILRVLSIGCICVFLIGVFDASKGQNPTTIQQGKLYAFTFTSMFHFLCIINKIYILRMALSIPFVIFFSFFHPLRAYNKDLF